MRLFIRRCNHCGRRIYLSIIASSREQLADRITYSFEIQCPHCRNYSYHTVEDVFAEIGASSVPPGAILGGLIGLVGGPLGALIGGALGAGAGAGADNTDRERVRRFNRGC